MSGLQNLQGDLSQYLLGGTDAAIVRRAVRVPPDIDPVARLDVYGNAYRERLRETLSRDYPVLLRLVGQEVFADLAYAYIDAIHSRSPNIRWYGAELASFIARQRGPPAAAHDMALFEWTIGLAFDAADAEPLNVADLAAVAPEAWAALRFMLHPSLQVIALQHAVTGWWLAAQDLDETGNLPAPPPPIGEHAWAVWRGSDGVRFRLLETDEADLLGAVGDNADFGSLCGLLAVGHGEMQAAPRAAGLLRNWVDAGWITGLS
jgi:hypothetical protein